MRTPIRHATSAERVVDADGGFWMVAKCFDRSVKQTLMAWTALETILSVVGFAMAGLVRLFGQVPFRGCAR